VATGTGLGEFPGHRGAINSVAYTPECKSLISGGADGAVLIWDVASILDSVKEK
jgi:WD40 repeat protein